jgi:photosystem II stability/assembly factor-like uncharacterized protein
MICHRLIRARRVLPTRACCLHRALSALLAVAGVLIAPAITAAPAWVPQTADEGTLARRGGVHAIAVDPAWPDRVYVTSNNAVFLSLDGGANFAALPPVPTFRHIHSLAVMRSMATSRDRPPGLLVGSEDGLYASLDGGRTYSPGIFEVPSPNPTVWDIRAVPGDGRVAYLATIQDFHRTDDGGLHWRHLDTPAAQGVNAVAWPAPDGKVVYLVPQGSNATTQDPSVRVQVTHGLPAPTQSSYFGLDVVGIDPAMLTSWFLISSSGTYRSIDGGVNWVLSGAAPFQCCFESLSVHGEILYALVNGFPRRSLDAGKTWSSLSLPAGDRRMFVRDPQSGSLYSGSLTIIDGTATLSRSRNDGDNWLSDSQGLQGGSIAALLVDPGNALYAITYDRLHGLPQAFTPWRDVNPFGRYPFPQTGFAQTTVLAGPRQLQTSYPYARSSDGGVTWSEGPQSQSVPIDVLTAEPGNANLLYGRYNLLADRGSSIVGASLRRSSDGGASWFTIEIASNPVTRHLLATGNNKLLADTTSGLWFSVNGGDTWMLRNDVPGTIVDVRARADRPATVFIVASSGIYRTADGGTTFVRTGDRPSPDASLLAVDFHTSNDLYLLEPSGRTFVSHDAGATWSAVVGPTTYGPYFADVALSPWQAGVLYAATDHGLRKLVTGSDVMLAREFYHADFDHYFMTADDAEAAALSIGTLPPWRPTGRTFSVWDTAAADRAPVCRFFSATFTPKSSHFYTPYPAECTYLQAQGVWTYEGTAFHLHLPQGLQGSGTCAAPGTQPLYRAYNNYMGNAPNHRYMTSPSLLDAMVGQGWVMEGEAATRVFACVPAQD